MTNQIEKKPYAHGISASIVTLKSGKKINVPIGLNVVIGTAPDADPAIFPLNTPKFITGTDAELEALGAKGTLAEHANLAFRNDVQQPIVYILVAESADDAETMVNIIGGINADGQPTGINAIKRVEAVTGHNPSIVIAPRFSHHQDVIDALLDAAEYVDGDMWCDAFAVGATRDKATAFALATTNDNKRFNVMYNNFSMDGKEHPSSIYAGLIHGNYLVYESCSNEVMPHVEAMLPVIEWREGDKDSLVSQLNEKGITCIVREAGEFKLCGARSASTDENWLYRHFTLLHKKIKSIVAEVNREKRDKNLTPEMLGFFFNKLDYELQKMVSSTINGTLTSQISGFELIRDAVDNTSEALKKGAWGFGIKYGRHGVNEQLHLIMMIDDAGFVTDTIQAIEGAE